MPQVNSIAAQAASILAQRRLKGEQGSVLPEALRPLDANAALAIQASVSQQLGERIGGWKCGLVADHPVLMAPIHDGTIHTTSPCPVFAGAGMVRIEPELAFILRHDLPARSDPYSPAEVDAAIARVHLALELIGSRYTDPAALSFADNLADGLLNQGLLIGPEINAAARAVDRIAIRVQRDDGSDMTLDGKHPNGNPRAPLYWLAEFLRSRGAGLQAGQAVITGSYAGSFDVPVGQDITMQFGELGQLAVRFTPK
jgi:2-keto-4-pentenoate hydratase